MAVAPVNGGVSIYIGPSPFSFAVGLAMDSSIAAAELDQVEDFFRSRCFPPRVVVCPYTDPSLFNLLQQRSYRLAELTSVLAINLTTLLPPVETLPGVVLRKCDESDCETWVDTVSTCFYGPDPGPEVRSRMAALFHVPDSLNVLATIAGKVASVAAGISPRNNSVAPLFGSSVLPQFRCRGLHGAMLGLRLQWAREAGCALAVATATPGSVSERNLIRYGFTFCYEKVTYVGSA